MSAAAAGHDDLLPRPPGGLAPGALLALLAHAALVAALAGAVDWRTQTPAVVSAELWAALPRSAAPPPAPLPTTPNPTPAPTPTPTPAPPPPPPPPAPAPSPAPAAPPAIAERDAQIAVERAAREKAQRAQAEREKAARDNQARVMADRERAQKAERDSEQARQRQRAAAEQAARVAEEARLAKQREDNLKRMLAQVDAAGSGSAPAGAAAQEAAPSAGYAGRLIAQIKPNIVLTEVLPATLAADVEVRAAPNGSILARRIVRSSGNATWDDAVLRAIDRTATLPRDTDGRVPGTLVITFRPS